MNYKRKTVSVQSIRDSVNRMIAAPKSTQEGRVALSVFLSSLLLETGNYHGFNYLGWTKEGGYEKWLAAEKEAQSAVGVGGLRVSTEPYLGDQTRVEDY